QDLRVWMLKRQDQLETQIRLSMGGSHGFFADSPEDGFDMLDLHDRIATVNEALKSDTIPVISSLTQNGTAFPGYESSDQYLLWREKAYGLALSQLVVGRLQLMDRASDWCVGLGFGEMMRIDCSDEHGASISNARRANALAFSLLVVGRTLLLERSLSAFLEQRRKLPQPDWLIHELGKLERAVHKVQETRQEYQKRARRYMEKWKDALGEVDRTYLRMDLLQEYFTLAASYNEIPYLISVKFSSMQLRDIYDEAAAAASSSGGAVPSSNPFMNERIGVNSVAARDHGLSAGHFQGLSQDTSRTMTEHGQASSHRNRQRRRPSSKDMLE
ncbi:hypothetical protein SeMB42_g03578, partial [Synchytrium endobioticum]